MRDARGPCLLDDPALVDRLLHGSDDEALTELGDAAVAVLDHLGEVVPGVDVHQREGEAAGAERLLGEAQQHDRVLPAGEEQHGTLELRCDLAHDVDCLGLELVEVGTVPARAHASACNPHSVLSLPVQRPSRPVPGAVQWVQPIDE